MKTMHARYCFLSHFRNKSGIRTGRGGGSVAVSWSFIGSATLIAARLLLKRLAKYDLYAC